METLTVSTGVRTLDIVLDEIANLNRLIMQRNDWLADTKNRSRSNYSTVKSDTAEMIWNLKDLKAEADELKKIQ